MLVSKTHINDLIGSRTRVAAGAAALVILLAGCGGGGSDSSSPPAPPAVLGTAARGAPIANATVTLKDRNGTAKTATTNAGGNYSIDVSGLTVPFLVKVDVPATTTSYFSVGSQAGVANITPLTDLIVEEFYSVQNLDAATVFATLSAASVVPTPDQIAIIAGVVKNIVALWLTQQGVDPATFNLITTPFVANGAGADAVLALTTVTEQAGTLPETVAITNGTTTTNATVTVTTASSQITVNTTTTNASGTSSSSQTTIVPTTIPQLQAVDGVNATMAAFRNTVNSKGNLLAASDLVPYTDATLLDGGRDRTWWTGVTAHEFRGLTFGSFTIDTIHSYDDANKIIDVTLAITVSQGALSSNFRFRFSFKRDAGTLSWLIYGDREIVFHESLVEMAVGMSGTGTTASKQVVVVVRALIGTVTSVTITDSTGTIFNNTPVLKSLQTELVQFDPTPGGPTTTIQRDVFGTNTSPLANFPAVGTVFTLTVTPATGPVVNYSVVSRGNTTEQTTITQPTGHTLASANLGGTLTAAWTLPTTFSVASRASSCGLQSASFSQTVEANELITPSSTGATYNLPATLNGQAVTSVTLNVSHDGPNGERTKVFYNMQ